jgi:nitrous oxidase accessory protein NosD
VSYTLRGRIESRLAAFVPVVVAACVLAAAEHRWWPVDAAGLMLGVGLALDVQAYHRVFRYQPGWAALPLGALELALVLLLMRAAGVAAPLGQAVALFAGGWLLSQLLAHAGFPLLRLTYAEDGGELGRLGGTAAVAAAAVLAGAGATAYAHRPPVVHLASGVHQGPIVITRREVLVGEPGAVVRGGIVVRASGVTVKNVSVVGGDYGISVEHVHGTVLDGVSVSGARLDGIHVRLAGVVVRDCSVDMLGNELGQGIDISYTMDMGRTLVEGCTVTGGMDGITTHSSMTDIVHNQVSRTTERGISVTEMSMGMVMDNEVRDASGIGIWCNDRSMCMIERNTVVDTRPGKDGPGFGVLASFQSEANLWENELGANPVASGAITQSEVSRARSFSYR